MVTKLGIEPDAIRIRKRQGTLIKRTRRARSMTREELAAALGVSTGAISHWECGRYSPRQGHQVELARALNVPWSLLFDLDAEVA